MISKINPIRIQALHIMVIFVKKKLKIHSLLILSTLFLLKHMYESVSCSFPVGNSLGDPAFEPADTEDWMLLLDPKCKEETQTLLSHYINPSYLSILFLI